MNYFNKTSLLAVLVVSLLWLGSFAQSDTAKQALPANALYMIDYKTSTKEEAENLDKGMIKSINVWKGEKATKKFGAKGKNGVVEINTFHINKRNPYNAVFTKAAKQAYFPGSWDGWDKYLVTNLKYPQTARQNKIEGTARVQFLVDKEGNLYDLRLLEDPGYGLGAEAVRLLEEGPKWIPAEQSGQNVINRLIVPVSFRL